MSAGEASRKQMVEAARSGDPRAQEELFRQVLPRLEAFVRRRSNEALRARVGQDDLVQTICREAIRDFDSFEDRGARSFENWLLTRAENKLRNKSRAVHAKKRDAGAGAKQTTSQIPTLTTPSMVAARHEQEERLHQALAELPEDHRRIIELVKLQGLSYAEAAERMDRSEGALRMLFTRAIGKLGVLMGRP